MDEIFECRICGYEGKPLRKDTYHFCPNCTVVFVDPEKFKEDYKNDELDEIGINEFFEKSIEENLE